MVEMCHYVRCVCMLFVKNFMTLLLSLPSPGNRWASAALEADNAMQSIVLGSLFSPSLPTLTAFLPSSLPSRFPGMQQLRIRLWRELSGTDPCCEPADKKAVCQT